MLVWDQWGTLATADPKAWRQAYQSFQVAIDGRAHARLVPLYVLLRGTGPVVDPDSGAAIPILDPRRLRSRLSDARRSVGAAGGRVGQVVQHPGGVGLERGAVQGLQGGGRQRVDPSLGAVGAPLR